MSEPQVDGDAGRPQELSIPPLTRKSDIIGEAGPAPSAAPEVARPRAATSRRARAGRAASPRTAQRSSASVRGVSPAQPTPRTPATPSTPTPPAAPTPPTTKEQPAGSATRSSAGSEEPLPSLGPQPGPLLPTDSFAAAGRKALWIQVGRMLEREEAVRDPSQTDALKRYRVATRRLRAGLRVFREAYPRRETKPIRTALSQLADALGTVRDLDVRLEEVDRWARDGGSAVGDAIGPLRRSLETRRRVAADALAAKLDSRGHRRLMTGLVGFVTAIEPEIQPHAGVPERATGDRAASSVWAAYEQVRAYASIVRWADLPTLHGLRIEAKRLRYTVEFLGSMLGPEQAWVLERLVALQDHLGALNDATLAVAAVRSFLGERHAGLTLAERAATVSYLGERERELARLRRGVGKAWRPVIGITFARKMARALVRRASA